jgi:hypothetical protein
MIGRLRPGVSREQAQAVLEAAFEQWVASTAPTTGSAPIFQFCASKKARVDSTAYAAATRSRSTSFRRWWV